MPGLNKHIAYCGLDCMKCPEPGKYFKTAPGCKETLDGIKQGSM
jgi:hypothetical protein